MAVYIPSIQIVDLLVNSALAPQFEASCVLSLFSPPSTLCSLLSKMASKACVYAACILQDADKEITVRPAARLPPRLLRSRRFPAASPLPRGRR